VRFEQRLRDGIHSGAIVLAFRRWKRSQVVAGRRYRTGIDMVVAEWVLLTLSFASGGGPDARRPSPGAGFRPGSARFSASRLRSITPRAGDPVNSQRGSAARGELI
jgi:hypothetical protein